MNKKHPVIGYKYNRLTIVGDTTITNSKNETYAKVKCDCGTIKSVRLTSLKGGKTKSCGCLSLEKLKERSITHGGSSRNNRHDLYQIWNGIKQRCFNKNCSAYSRYGGRGINVCERWLNFENFKKDMGARPSKFHSIERINNDGDYSYMNCKWGTMEEQGNNKRNNIIITFKGETHTLSEWSRLYNIKYRTLHARINDYNWSFEQALKRPTRR